MTAPDTRRPELVEFLLARIAEDEAAALKCAEAYPPPWDVSDRGHTATVQADEPNFWTVTVLEQSPALGDAWLSDYLQNIARHDPARVLAECEAKRRIVALHEGYHECVGISSGGQSCVLVAPGYLFEHDPTLCLLALPYAEHPDYREEWKP